MSLHKSGKRRIEIDVHKLINEGKHQVTMLDDPQEFYIKFCGPSESLYVDGTWSVKIKLTESYPFKPPSVRFVNRIYHPNIDEETGILPMEIINESWTIRHNLSDLFDYFLPELLSDPNINNSINKIAAAMYCHAPEEYKKVVKEYVRQYAK